MSRKLVTIRKISSIDPIPGADAIEVATVDGWKVVVKKGEYEVGQYVVYFEIDSILPKGRPEFEFLMSRGCKEQTTDDPEVTLYGHRLRTITLRGQVSQGLVIPLPQYWSIHGSIVTFPVAFAEDGTPSAYEFERIGEDFSAAFGVMKYEKPIPINLAGKVRGNYPSWLPKTDQERIQNCWHTIQGDEGVWMVEEKVEGSSITVYCDGDRVGVTSRNLDLELDQVGNTFVDVAKASGLVSWLERLAAAPKNTGIDTPRYAIRGELVGPGIQNNIYNLNSHRIYIYDIWINTGYIAPHERRTLVDQILESDLVNNEMVVAVPIVHDAAFVDTCSLDDILLIADGASAINPATLREGVVYKSYTSPNVSFKAISNKYLLKEVA